jgi:hypothetical protein
LLPEEIIGTEDVPEYISSDSSLEAEEATLEQRTSHQLRRRVFGTWSTASGTSPLVARPNTSVAWLWRH